MEIKFNKKKGFWLSALLALSALFQMGASAVPVSDDATEELDNTRRLNCTSAEHVHTAECYGDNLVCIAAESAGHTHSESCYNGEKELFCGLQESVGHKHGLGCYAPALVCTAGQAYSHTHSVFCFNGVEPLCGIPAGEGHIHGDACLGKEYTCTELGIEGHIHNELCSYNLVYVCGLPESVGHAHSLECYAGLASVCGLTETAGHIHDGNCYVHVTGCPLNHEHTAACACALTLSCTLPESAEHSHGEGCYTQVPGAALQLICQLAEQPAHAHTDSCWKLKPICGCAESAGHTHTLSCYELLCTEEAHTHDESCYIYCTCNSGREIHTKDCPLFTKPVCTCGSTNTVHAPDCPVFMYGRVDVEGEFPQAPQVRELLIERLYRGAEGRMVCEFDGYISVDGRHEGIDFFSAEGAPIYAVLEGDIIALDDGFESGMSRIAIYNGEQATSTGYYTMFYFHARPLDSLQVGMHIATGQLIGYEAQAGEDVHTHLELVSGCSVYAQKSGGDPILNNPNPYPIWQQLLAQPAVYEQSIAAHDAEAAESSAADVSQSYAESKADVTAAESVSQDSPGTPAESLSEDEETKEELSDSPAVAKEENGASVPVFVFESAANAGKKGTLMSSSGENPAAGRTDDESVYGFIIGGVDELDVLYLDGENISVGSARCFWKVPLGVTILVLLVLFLVPVLPQRGRKRGKHEK